MKRLLLIPVIALALMLNSPLTGVSAAAKAKKGKAGASAITSVDKAGKSHVAKGYVSMKAAPGAKQFAASPKIKNAALPRKVDLRSKMTKIEDQGETSSCVANAVAGSFEYWVKRATKEDIDVSRLFVYFNARWRNGDQKKDEGCVIQLAMAGLKEFGACSEESWPFSKPLLLKKPNGEAYKEAKQVKIKEMAQVPLDLKTWKQALASGYPIVFGCLLFDSFDQCNERGGVVPMPSPDDLGRSTHGGHSMCVVGYSDKEQVFIVRNSWGNKWGDKGYCYMPYNYLMNPQFNDGDSWVFVPETPIENPEDTWSDDDKPVTDDGRGVKFVINPYTVDNYAKVKVTWWEEMTVEYNDAAPEQYETYVEYSASDKWRSMESFDYNEVIKTWKKKNPGEETDLYVYEGVDAGGDSEADVTDAEVSEDDGDDSGDEDMEEEVDEDDGDDSGDEDMEEEVDEDDGDDSGDEDMEEEAYEDESEDSGDEDMEEEVYEDGSDDSGDEDMEEEAYEDGGDDSGDEGGDE